MNDIGENPRTGPAASGLEIGSGIIITARIARRLVFSGIFFI